MMGRHDTIRYELTWLTQHDVIVDWYAYAPDGSGKRWFVIPRGSTGATFTTREVEAFIVGALAALDKQAYEIR